LSRYKDKYHTVRVAGSKLNHLQLIYSYFPPIDDWKHFIDPMGGSLAVELNLPVYDLPFSKRKVISVNDLDERLIDLAICQLFYPERVHRAINYSMKSQAFLKWLRENNDELRKDMWTSGMSKYYELQFAFSAKNTGSFRYGANTYRGGHPNHSLEYYHELSRRLKEIQFFSEDYKKFLDRWIGKVDNGFVYADPPYFVAAGSGYYNHEFTHNDHVEFADKMQEMNDDGFLICISYDNNENIYKLYKDWYIREVSLRYSLPSSGNPIKTELIITNYKTNVKKQGSLDKWLKQ
jgi:DNA adenine methylase